MSSHFEYWFLLPVGVVVATVATSSGLAGSNFWIPVYLRWLELEPRLVFWMSLVTMTFGFGSAVARNLAARTVDWRLFRRYGAVAAPAAGVAAVFAARAPQEPLLAAFAVFAAAYGVLLVVAAARRREPRALPPLVAGLAGGASQGLIATGAGALTLPSMLRGRQGHPAAAVGASVLLVFVCTLIAAALRLDPALLRALDERGGELAAMVAFAAPGVVIGGQLGPRLTRRIPEQALRPYVGGLLVAVAALVASRIW